MAHTTRQDPALQAAVGQRLREHRLRAGRRQWELAAAAGITQAAVSTYEHGRGRLSLTTAMHIAVALGTSLDAMFGGLLV